MAGTRLNWTEELERWLAPFLARLGHKARRRMCPLYLAGLIGPGDRKSVQPMAELRQRPEGITAASWLLRLYPDSQEPWRLIDRPECQTDCE